MRGEACNAREDGEQRQAPHASERGGFAADDHRKGAVSAALTAADRGVQERDVTFRGSPGERARQRRRVGQEIDQYATPRHRGQRFRGDRLHARGVRQGQHHDVGALGGPGQRTPLQRRQRRQAARRAYRRCRKRRARLAASRLAAMPSPMTPMPMNPIRIFRCLLHGPYRSCDTLSQALRKPNNRPNRLPVHLRDDIRHPEVGAMGRAVRGARDHGYACREQLPKEGQAFIA